ncbi:MAG: DUF2029 domain-containing protein [Crocinitomicaceae bacterium]|nr:glycosyltransferase 87 family protein [Flavobacteriales bacterium]NQZ37891.1 DUF2029 domain-containing protein [Crocinitomicaceae bacterium]
MKSSGAIWRMGIILCFISSIFLVNWQADRTNFAFIAVFYTLAFVSYVLLLREESKFSFKHLAFIALGAQVVSMLYVPNLSDDYFRFLWDGEITWLGINPFDFKPQDLTDEAFMKSDYMQEVYAGVSDLSRKNYSCYPPVNQAYFIASTAFSSSIPVNVFMMKLLIVLTELAGVFHLRKLLIHFKVNPKRLWIVFLNPLFVIECTGNVHFEGVMLSLLFIALYFLFTSRLLLGALIFALAVQIKLVPLILLPFFLRHFPWRKAFYIYFVIGISVIGLGITQLNASNFGNFLHSLALYFKVFEFNSFLFYNYNLLIQQFTTYNPLAITGPILSGFVLISILFYALRRSTIDWKVLLQRMLFGFFIYLILGSTLHPWYVIPLLGLSVFTNFAFPMVWSFLVFFSYFFYSIGSGNSFEVRAMTSIEYILFFAYFIYEWKKNGSPFGFLRIDHYQKSD